MISREERLREERPTGGQHSAAFISLWVQLVVRAGVSMRGVAAVLEVMGEYLGQPFPIPPVTTGRGWLLRLGLAGVRPPSLRTKARFLNIAPLIAWGIQARRLRRRCRTRPAPAGMTAARVEDKLPWLDEFADALREWREWMQVTDLALEIVRTQGHSPPTPDLLDRRQPRPLAHPSSTELADQLLAFVTRQSAPLRPGERLPGSSEVLESTFGKFKTLERDQSQGGFTSLILSLGTVLFQARHTQSATPLAGLAQTVKHGLERCGMKTVLSWLAQNLASTVTAQRRTAFQSP